MIAVTVEILPGGSDARRRTVAMLRIANLSDLAPLSSYSVDVLESANPIAGSPSRIAACTIEQHDRRQSVLKLVARALAELDDADFVEL